MLTLLLPALALALTHADADIGEVHGWTADGALVYELHQHGRVEADVVDSEDDVAPVTVRHVVVQRGDAIVHDWILHSDYPDSFADEAPETQESAWKAWRKSHPLTPAVHAREGASGARLELRVEPWSADGATAPEPTCDGGTCTVTTDVEHPQSTFVRVGLSSSGDGFWPLGRREIAPPTWSAAVGTWFSAWWTPEGDVVAWVVDRPSQQTMRGPVFGDAALQIAPAAPLIAVLAPASLGPRAAEGIAARLADLGATQTGEAKAERDHSVVYWAEGFEDAAMTIATKIPGGATVEPMTWQGAQHVVVAVGSSAR